MTKVIGMAGFASKVADKMMKQYGLFDSSGESPSVTVVIPAFNEAGYVGNAVRSALNQVYRGSVVVMVVDDGSSDGTGKAASEAGAKVYEIKNSGVSAARNYGMQKSDNDIVMFLDADSEMPSNAIARVVDSARKGYIAGSFSKSSGNPTDDLFNGYTNAVNSIFTPIRNIFGAVPSSGSGTCMYVCKHIAKKGNVRFNEEQTSREDSDFLCEMSRYGFVDFISDVEIKTSPRRSEGKSVAEIAAKKLTSYLNPCSKYGHIEGRMAA